MPAAFPATAQRRSISWRRRAITAWRLWACAARPRTCFPPHCPASSTGSTGTCGAVRRGPKGERCDQRPRERLRTYPHGAAGSGLLRRLPAHAARRRLCGGGQAASSGAAYSLCTAHCADAGIGSGSGSAGHGASAFTTPVGSALCRQRAGRSRRVVDSVFCGFALRRLRCLWQQARCKPFVSATC